MKFLRFLVGLVRWAVMLGTLLLALGLVIRGLLEYLPHAREFLPFRVLIKWGDPYLQDIFAATKLAWNEEMRGVGLPMAGAALFLIRAMLEDLFDRLTDAMQPKKKPAASEPEPAPVAAAAASAAVSASHPSLEATEIRPAGAQAAVQGPTGTAYMPAYKSAPSGPPTHIGRYEIIEELGRGAMGTVYKARDPKIGRTVAIKTISAVGMGPELQEYRERFMIEAKSAGRLTHPGVVGVYDVTDDEQGRPCLVLEFVEGKTLDKITSKSRLPLALALDYVSQIARALAYAHAQGIIHRDVKPANIMVTSSGQAKLSDFGIAKIEGTTLTVAGQVLGTPAFMSPEQCRGAPIDHRSDIFSLGAVLYLLTTHTRPFPGDTFTSVAYQVVHNEQLPVNEVDPGLPTQLQAMIARCLSKQADARYPSAAQLADDLDGLRQALAAQTPAKGNESGLPAA